MILFMFWQAEMRKNVSEQSCSFARVLLRILLSWKYVSSEINAPFCLENWCQVGVRLAWKQSRPQSDQIVIDSDEEDTAGAACPDK